MKKNYSWMLVVAIIIVLILAFKVNLGTYSVVGTASGSCFRTNAPVVNEISQYQLSSRYLAINIGGDSNLEGFSASGSLSGVNRDCTYDQSAYSLGNQIDSVGDMIIYYNPNLQRLALCTNDNSHYGDHSTYTYLYTNLNVTDTAPCAVNQTPTYECNYGQSACIDAGHYKTCQANGYWSVSFSCSSNMVCSQGTCVTSVIPCTNADWTSSLGACTNNIQILSWNKIGQCTGGVTHPATENQVCNSTVITPSCVYTYSNWDNCTASGTQSRTVISSTPLVCSGSPQLSQTCNYNGAVSANNFLTKYMWWIIGGIILLIVAVIYLRK
jgi:hypothetical protein